MVGHRALPQRGVELPPGLHRHQGGEAVTTAKGRERGPLSHQGVVGVATQIVAQGDAPLRQVFDVLGCRQLLELHQGVALAAEGRAQPARVGQACTSRQILLRHEALAAELHGPLREERQRGQQEGQHCE